MAAQVHAEPGKHRNCSVSEIDATEYSIPFRVPLS